MKFYYLIPALAVAALCAAGCKNNASEDLVAKTQVETITLKDTCCTIDYNFPATIKGIQDVDIYPQVSGRITSIKVKEGQFVKDGDVLFTIDDIPYQAAYDQAAAQVEVSKAQLETAKLTFQSKQNLFDKNIISEYQLKLAKNDVATAEAVLGQSKAALKNAANDLSFTKVRTMGKGYIGTLPYKVGSLVGPTLIEPMTVVSDNSSIYADFSIPENLYLKIAANRTSEVGQVPLNLRTNLGEKYAYQGKVHSYSGLISSETGSIIMRSIFPNPDGLLLSGGSCTVVLTTTEEGVIMIPRSAMREIQNKLFVFVVKDGAIAQTEVKAMRYDAKTWVLLPDDNGEFALKVDDVITKTTNRLNDGMQVEVIK